MNHVDELERELAVQMRELSRAKGEIVRLRSLLGGAVDAVVWMSGSPSFAPEGEAHAGWVKIRGGMDAWFDALRE